jgi:UDP-3-O-[3-hydroxymyristoyl] N-acetylglucosamine deacetylase/3-hydroxyacyl-[acyl-carrier-protein] dehydratase
MTNSPGRQTLASPAEVAGRGLHTGQAVTARMLPADAGSGIRFRRSDVSGADPIPATVDNVSGTDRGTTLGTGENVVHTVEHLLAAIQALALDDVRIEVDGPELPAGDGSAGPFFTALSRAGRKGQGGEPLIRRLPGPTTVREGDATYLLAPAPALRLTVTIEWDHPLIGRQSRSSDVTEQAFAGELAGARTFGFVRDAEALRARGLARGASPDTTILLTDSGLASGSLRWPDEFVRHKTVDLLGDLALAGGRIAAEVVAFRPSHAGNVAVARAVRRLSDPPASAVMGIQEILGVMPHRYPMLLVDRIIEVQGRERIVGIKNVTFNESFFQGHFPGHPVMPGVLVIEAMAQVGGMLLMGAVDQPETKLVYFMGIDGVRFRRPVVPGDQLRLELEMIQFRGRNCRMKGTAYVDGQAAAEAEMLARIVDR